VTSFTPSRSSILTNKQIMAVNMDIASSTAGDDSNLGKFLEPFKPRDP
jgi:hypothetical protein